MVVLSGQCDSILRLVPCPVDKISQIVPDEEQDPVSLGQVSPPALFVRRPPERRFTFEQQGIGIDRKVNAEFLEVAPG